MWGNKYRNKKTSIDGYCFSSKLEASVYLELKRLENLNQIKIEQTQAQVHLTNAKILYKPDFKILNLNTNEIEYIEAKGVETASWRIKRKLWMYYGPGKLTIYKGNSTRVFISEVLQPKL